MIAPCVKTTGLTTAFMPLTIVPVLSSTTIFSSGLYSTSRSSTALASSIILTSSGFLTITVLGSIAFAASSEIFACIAFWISRAVLKFVSFRLSLMLS